MGWLKEVNAEDLAVLLKGGRLLHIPTTGWGETVVGSGVKGQQPTYNYVGSGTTANSSSILSVEVRGISAYDNIEQYINWAKKLYLLFGITRQNSDAQAIGRIQLKQSGSIGALAAKGIGLRIDNYALVGESYGTVLGEVDLATTLTSQYVVDVLLVHDPSVPKIEWYVDSGSGMVLKGTQSTATKIPGGVGTGMGYMVHSIANGVTGGVSAYSGLNMPAIWQER